MLMFYMLNCICIAQDWLPIEGKKGWAQYLDGRPLVKTKLQLEEKLGRPTGGAMWVLTPQYSEEEIVL